MDNINEGKQLLKVIIKKSKLHEKNHNVSFIIIFINLWFIDGVKTLKSSAK
jgi:hypothetical protein